MNYLTTIHSDIGIKKQVNQDSCLIMEADTDLGHVLLCVICDGMGGLSRGELASATVIKAFAAWFREELPGILCEAGMKDFLFSSWENLLVRMNDLIYRYGEAYGLRLGTTVCAALFVGAQYYIVNVGDSRAYRLTDEMIPLTRDQSFVQMEIDAGRMTKEQALSSSMRSVLLYCIGANEVVQPDFYTGAFGSGELFLLCSDGFVHKVPENEMFNYLDPDDLLDEAGMLNAAAMLTEMIKQRQETDNISAILVKTI